MRVLFVSHAEKTHFFSMVPLAWALRTAGHEVRVATQPEMANAVAESGLVAVPLGTDHKWKEVMQSKSDDDWSSRAVDAVGSPSSLDFDDLYKLFDETVRNYLRTINNDEFLDALVAYAQGWQPDLIIWEQFTPAGAVAARVTGAAHARMLWGADVNTRTWSDFRARLAEQPGDQRVDPLEAWLTEAAERHGTTYEDTLVNGQWTIDLNPPSQRIDNGLKTVGVRYIPYNGKAELPEWLAAPTSKPRVAVTAGLSLRGYFGIDMFSIKSLHAFADLDIEVIATLVPQPDETVESAPANATVVDFVPMQALLPTCSAVIHIGGAGVQSTASYYGVPQLILPGLWDTVVRAELTVGAGAALAVLGHEITPERLRGDLLKLLEDPYFQAGAAKLRDDVLSAPTPNEVVPILEELTTVHRSAA